jgi:(2Fe-2S) ferredoxin
MSNECTFVLICVNKKEGKKCCAMFEPEAAFERFRELLKQKQSQMPHRVKVKAVKTSCLGQCAAGPNIYITPDNVWYTFSCLEDIDEIVEVHFIQGKTVERLLNRRLGQGPT